MSPLARGLLLGLLQLAIVGSLGAKLLLDRARLPAAWVRTAPIDPDLPIRGRYVRLRLEVDGSRALVGADSLYRSPVRLVVTDSQLAAVPAERETRLSVSRDRTRPDVAVLDQPVAFFIPEHIPDPSIRPGGEELWAEVTVPRRGVPRPIRLGVRRDGELRPLR